MTLTWTPKGKDVVKPIHEIKLKDGVTIGIFQGSRGANPNLDIVVKYLNPKTSMRLRTPKHIHWVIDLLIKKQHNKKLTMEFIVYLSEMWKRLDGLKSKSEQQNIESKLSSDKDLRRFEELNKYGEYSVEFIAYIIELFVIEEKTGMKEAFIFDDLFKALLNEKDIFYIVSKATW